ncbi:hypothetical protein LJC61_02545 [Ruminococcaceae bacterium OttesenSCG-928-A16]|nr:hypothetical protein [Ruminococcaceae bacterium OttesenSCG-928-A16]
MAQKALFPMKYLRVTQGRLTYANIEKDGTINPYKFYAYNNAYPNKVNFCTSHDYTNAIDFAQGEGNRFIYAPYDCIVEATNFENHGFSSSYCNMLVIRSANIVDGPVHKGKYQWMAFLHMNKGTKTEDGQETLINRLERFRKSGEIIPRGTHIYSEGETSTYKLDLHVHIECGIGKNVPTNYIEHMYIKNSDGLGKTNKFGAANLEDCVYLKIGYPNIPGEKPYATSSTIIRRGTCACGSEPRFTKICPFKDYKWTYESYQGYEMTVGSPYNPRPNSSTPPPSTNDETTQMMNVKSATTGYLTLGTLAAFSQITPMASNIIAVPAGYYPVLGTQQNSGKNYCKTVVQKKYAYVELIPGFTEITEAGIINLVAGYVSASEYGLVKQEYDKHKDIIDEANLLEEQVKKLKIEAKEVWEARLAAEKYLRDTEGLVDALAGRINQKLSLLNSENAVKLSSLQKEISNLFEQLSILVKKKITDLGHRVQAKLSGFWHKLKNQRSPVTGRRLPLDPLMEDLFFTHKQNGLTAHEYEQLGVSATAYKNKEISAFTYATNAKSHLI